MKDDSVSYIAFTEQVSSTPHISASAVLDLIVGLPRCVGQACDAVSTCTQLKMEDAPTLLKFPKPECSEMWISHIVQRLEEIDTP